jgi:hypothetical protein
MTATQEILDLIETRLRALDEEIEALGAARAALGDSDAALGDSEHRAREPSRNGAGAPTPPARRALRARRARRRAAVAVSPETLEQLLSQTEGLSTSELTEQAGGDRHQILRLLRELETAGRIRRAGQRRGTRWHAVTDEERIQRRAAELASRSRASAA